jgi:hypothetical protein
MFLSKFSANQNANTYRFYSYLQKFMMSEVTLKSGCLSFCGFPCECSFHHCSISMYHCPLRCAISSTRQHIITSSVFKLSASSLTWHLTDYRAWRFFPFYWDSNQPNVTVHWEWSRLLFSSYLIRILRDFQSFIFLSLGHPKLVHAYFPVLTYSPVMVIFSCHPTLTRLIINFVEQIQLKKPISA